MKKMIVPKGESFDGNDPRFSEYLRYLEENTIVSVSGGWGTLCHDAANDIYWQIDIWEKYQRRLAIRLSSRDSFPLSKDRIIDSRMKFLEASRGLSAEECQWQNCTHRALNGLAFCCFHAFTEMGVR